nr:GNAT family N-acetyltransferase [Aggregatilinea lenta]
MLRRTDKLATNQRGLGLVAVCDDAPCGFGLLTLWPRAGEISDLVVAAGLRGRGIGTRLVETLSDAATGLGVRTLEIGAALSNPRALALYRRLGFVDARTIELDLGCGLEPVVYLTKRLTPR